MHRTITLNDGYKKTQLFVILFFDLIALVLSFFTANFIRLGDPFNAGVGPYEFRFALATILLTYIVVFLSRRYHKDFFKRGPLAELFSIIKVNTWTFAVLLIILFALQVTADFSRIIVVLTWGISIVYMLILTNAVKYTFRALKKMSKNRRFLVVVTTTDLASETINMLQQENVDYTYEISGVILMDNSNLHGMNDIRGVPVIGSEKTMYTCVTSMPVDEVFINLNDSDDVIMEEIVDNYENLGLVVNVSINLGVDLRIHRSAIRYFCGFSTVSFEKATQSFKMTLFKRCFDIVLSSIGLVFASLLTLILAPILLIESPGPLLFSQIRVGKNGRKFKIYKFRSMYKDAESRKKELMTQNEMEGLLFKIENDPRITKVGAFIRKTSIDELPQLWNVLKGDMSMIGTRPPTLDEYEKYEPSFKRRLSIKPGITGLWQVSGRNDIKKFEEVLSLDLKYIDKWSPGLEIKILLKTVWVIFARAGAR